MRQTRKWIIGTLVIAGIIFALSPGPRHLIENPDRWELREQFVYLTGVSALSMMVLSTLISVRIPWINRQMSGLDKAYVVHKWTGILSTILIIFHWLGEKIPHWLIDWEIIPNPGELSDGTEFSALEINLFQSGVILVEYTFYIIIVLVIVALFKKVPYHIFRKTHKIFPVVFLVAAYHGATAQMKEHWLSSPAGYLLLVLITIGVSAALISLFQRIGISRKITASIKEIEYHENKILDIRLTCPTKKIIHKPGQYAFLRFENNTEPHPFTIASSGDDPHAMRFAIKSLGNFTDQLSNLIKPGQVVEIEGPYGEFKFEAPAERQIWIAGGIGITPFVARLEYLVNRGGAKEPVDFWYSTRGDRNNIFPDNLEYLCKQSGVNFYHLNSMQQEYLTVEIMHQVVGSFGNVSIWFCGPPAFSKCLLKGLDAYDFDRKLFYVEDFNMR